MTRNGRNSGSEKDETSDNTQSDESSGQASSGVFRAAADAKRRDSGWTLAEQFVREGFSYRLMRRPLEFSKVPPRLTRREEDAVVLACTGHSNKSIAQVMDVAPSTVGVLLFRAAAKLNAKSRSELLSNYEQFRAAAALDAPGEASKRAK
jgi:DNA-binding CsgD family transcriptional regulator